MLKVVKSFFDGLSPKEKKMAYITMGVLALMVFDRVIIGPISSESRMTEERIEHQTRQTEKNIRLLGYKERIIEENADYSQYYTSEGLSREVLIASFLGEIEGKAKSAGIVLSNINPVNVVERDGYDEFGLVIECQGTMKSILDFLYDIDSAQKPIRTGSFEISVRNRENYEVRCNVTVLKMIITREELDLKIPEQSTVSLTERVELE